jgi:hypothetical protein
LSVRLPLMVARRPRDRVTRATAVGIARRGARIRRRLARLILVAKTMRRRQMRRERERGKTKKEREGGPRDAAKKAPAAAEATKREETREDQVGLVIRDSKRTT